MLHPTKYLGQYCFMATLLMWRKIVLLLNDSIIYQIQAPSEEKSAQWKDLEAALTGRTCSVNDATTALLKAK